MSGVLYCVVITRLVLFCDVSLDVLSNTRLGC